MTEQVVIQMMDRDAFELLPILCNTIRRSITNIDEYPLFDIGVKTMVYSEGVVYGSNVHLSSFDIKDLRDFGNYNYKTYVYYRAVRVDVESFGDIGQNDLGHVAIDTRGIYNNEFAMEITKAATELLQDAMTIYCQRNASRHYKWRGSDSLEYLEDMEVAP